MHSPKLQDLPVPHPGKTGWPWTEGTPPAAGSMADGSAWPRISIVTPSYNQGQFIEETIRSVLLQGYPDLEYIIIDGGSTDESAAIVKAYGPWLAHWTSEKDRGQTHAINKGFAVASGQIHCYLNSDDILYPGALQQVAQRFAKQSAPALICCSGKFFGPAMNRLWGTAEAAPPSERDWNPPKSPRLTDWLTTYSSLLQQSTFWDSRITATLGGFSEELNFCFDKEFFLRALFELKRYTACPEIIASGHRLHDDCKTATIPDVMARENEQIWSRYAGQHWCQRTLRREALERRGYELMATALQQPGPVMRLGNLIRSAFVWPGVLRSRMFWGALRRVSRSYRANA
jgi:glycosyltransferase involved in cell wall biosynthesis